MNERRAAIRERVIYGATADAGSGRSRPCVVRNFSEEGAHVVFSNDMRVPDDIGLTIARKGKSYRAHVVWWRNNAAGVAFRSAAVVHTPSSEFEERLRTSEKKTRQLKRRVRELLGEG